jgi:hypothetical protein
LPTFAIGGFRENYIRKINDLVDLANLAGEAEPEMVPDAAFSLISTQGYYKALMQLNKANAKTADGQKFAHEVRVSVMVCLSYIFYVPKSSTFVLKNFQ